MKFLVVFFLVLVSCQVHGQRDKAIPTKPGWTKSSLELMNMGLEIRNALGVINEKPIQVSERVLSQATCGEVLVYTVGTKDSKDEEMTNIRSTFNGQTPERIAFCWLNEVRRRFAAEEAEAEHDPAIESFIREMQLTFLTEPDSVYVKLVKVYCSNGGTLYTGVTGTTQECTKTK